MGGKEEEFHSKEKTEGCIFPLFSCSLFNFNMLSRLQKHTADSSQFNEHVLLSVLSQNRSCSKLALELETWSTGPQPHPGLSLPGNLLQESKLSLGDRKGKRTFICRIEGCRTSLLLWELIVVVQLYPEQSTACKSHGKP